MIVSGTSDGKDRQQAENRGSGRLFGGVIPIRLPSRYVYRREVMTGGIVCGARGTMPLMVAAFAIPQGAIWNHPPVYQSKPTASVAHRPRNVSNGRLILPRHVLCAVSQMR